MLTRFDWLRRSRTGAELLALLNPLAEDPDSISEEDPLGGVFSALEGPCRRCWIYPRQTGDPCCRVCRSILQRRRQLAPTARYAMVVWGFVNPLPASLQPGPGTVQDRALGAYVHDEHHFLMMIRRPEIKLWVQRLVLRHGLDLRGVIQIFPAVGAKSAFCMGDLLCRIIHHESYLPMDRLRVRFYTTPSQVITPQKRDRQGILTFDIADFLGLLETAEVFRAGLRPDEQKELLELLALEDAQEASFFWGRFTGRLEQRTKDMLAAWNLRSWSRERVQLLSELIEYVALPPLP